jgi:hypothetical protein
MTFPFQLERLWKDPEAEWHPVTNPEEVYETLTANFPDMDSIVEMLDNGHEIQTPGAYYRKDDGAEQAVLDAYYNSSEKSK